MSFYSSQKTLLELRPFRSGQVGPDVDEDELIEAFKRHGRLVGYKLIRGSNCGFIDYERVEDAASARADLHEATFSSCQIRVEFKVCSPCMPAGFEISLLNYCNFMPLTNSELLSQSGLSVAPNIAGCLTHCLR